MSQFAKTASLQPPLRQQNVTVNSSSALTAGLSATRSSAIGDPSLKIALLTGGGDKPYALGLVKAVTAQDISVDFIGSDYLNVPELLNNSQVRFLNLRRDQRPDADPVTKTLRVIKYYVRLVCYVATSHAKIFHILWNNKFELFDRTLLMLYYKLLSKRLVLTVHNVNARKRDARDSFLNRLSLRIQYRLSDHIFVHTGQMKKELLSDFGVRERKVSIIPFGINNTVPNTQLTSSEAKQRLGLSRGDKTILFFGNIAPYKGLEYLVTAFGELVAKDDSYCLVIAGHPKGPKTYWNQIQQTIARDAIRSRTIEKIEYIPDDDTELYFKAADILVLPYTRIFQSGVLFLGYSFGLPVIAADVGPLKEEIVEGDTGFVFKSRDSSDLAKVIGRYFESELFRNLESRRVDIKQYANERYSWDDVATKTRAIYWNLVKS
jgi:glycosyltransferase involved in cell wall biosynthesis